MTQISKRSGIGDWVVLVEGYFQKTAPRLKVTFYIA